MGSKALPVIAAGILVGVTVVLVSSNLREFSTASYLVLFVGVALFLAAVAKKKHPDALSPVMLMSVGWLVPVVLHSLDLSHVYLAQLRAETWLVIIGTFLLFNIGCFLLIGQNNTRLVQQCKIHSVAAARRNTLPKLRLSYFLYGYFAVGVGAWLYKVSTLGGTSSLPLLSAEPDTVRWQQPPKIVGQFPVLLLVVMLLCLVCWDERGIKDNKRLIPIFAISLIPWALETARSSLYQVILTGMLYWALRRGRIPKKWLAVVAAGCLSFFILITTQRANRAPGFTMDLSVDAVRLPRPLAMPYMYLTESLTNLQLNLEAGRSVFEGGGVRTFAPILSWLQIRKTPQFRNYLSYWPGGISVYQADLYIDFGLAGLILGPLLIGIMCGWAYRWSRVQQTALGAMTYAVLGVCVLTSGFVNWFNSPTSLFFLILIPPALWRPGFSTV